MSNTSLTSTTLVSNGYTITHSAHVAPENVQKLTKTIMFNSWTESLQREHKSLRVESINVTEVNMFGPNVGFANVHANVTNAKGKKLPGIVFMRSPAVAVLVVLITPDGEKTVVGVRQPRVPVGRSDYLEIAAGMLDDSNNFTGVAAKELKEELGLEIKAEELIDLCSKVSGQNGNGPDIDIGPSVGGCNETIKLFLCVKHVTQEFLDSLKNRIIENNEHDTWETITVELIKYAEAWKIFKDVKALCALMYSEKLGLI